MKTVDIIVPCYNEEPVLTSYYNETEKVVSGIQGYTFNYIFVNDGSKDNTMIILKGLAASYDNVKYISFSRNFGKESELFRPVQFGVGLRNYPQPAPETIGRRGFQPAESKHFQTEGVGPDLPFFDLGRNHCAGYFADKRKPAEL